MMKEGFVILLLQVIFYKCSVFNNASSKEKKKRKKQREMINHSVENYTWSNLDNTVTKS